MTTIKEKASGFFKKWVNKRYTSIQANEAYESEKSRQISLLSIEKEEVEAELSRFDFENVAIDYEGIKKIKIEGEMVTAWTQSEQYTVRIKEYDDLFTFFRNLNLPETSHTLIDREKWIISTPISSNVNLDDIPKLEFLYADKKEARIHLDLSSAIELIGIRGILNTLHGEFNIEINYEKIKEVFAVLGKHLNSWHKYDFIIKIDASDVRKFTFYLENDEGDMYPLKNIRPFDVEKLLMNRQMMTLKIKELIMEHLEHASEKLEKIKEKRIAKEREDYRREKAANIQQSLPYKLAKVKVIYDQVNPLFSANTLGDLIEIQADAGAFYEEAVVNLDTIKGKLQQESKSTQRFIENMNLCIDSALPFSLEKNNLRIDLKEKEYEELIFEVNQNAIRLLKEHINKKMKKEQPQIRQVIQRFDLSEEGHVPYDIEKGFISVFISDSEYHQLVATIRRILRDIALYELDDVHHTFSWKVNEKVFGISMSEGYSLVDGEYIRVTTIKKEAEESYKRYFKDGQLI